MGRDDLLASRDAGKPVTERVSEIEEKLIFLKKSLIETSRLTIDVTMAEHVLERRQIIERPREEVFEFFADAGNLERITPPELNFKIISAQPIDIKQGAFIDYKLKLRGIPV